MVEATTTTEAFMDRQKRVLVAGGGVAALEAVLALRRIAEERVQVELLAPEPCFTYRALSVAAPFELGEVLQLELDDVARELGARFTQAGLVGIDAWRHVAHTSKNTELEYDLLLIACGAVAMPAVRGALAFRGPADVELISSLLRDLTDGSAHSVAFVIPWGAVYSLPAYELALLTASYLQQRDVGGVEIGLVTPEVEPLQVFGPPASEAIRNLFAEKGIALRTGAFPREVVDGELALIPDGSVVADRIVALPRLVGTPIDGVPQTVDGFVPVDAHCRVHGVADVYAAGDITSFTVKHGGIATQQADAAAEAIAAAAGVDIEPARFQPVLRGVLLTGTQPRYLRRELGVERRTEPAASLEPLWWPPAKVVGRRLAPYLASKAGADAPPELPADAPGVVEIERALVPHVLEEVDATRLALSVASDDEPSVDGVMSRTAVVVEPDDTLGEAAEVLLRADARAAVVTEFGRIVGVVTSSDLLRASAARAHPAEARVRQWMTAEPLTLPPDASVIAARILMEQYGIDHLPVVEEDRPLGIVDRESVEHVAIATPGLGF
jgi:sulfide:quinone oxidoreductase